MSNRAASPMAASSSSTAAGRASGKATSFIPELQSMMLALRPLHVTAALVEDVVHTQLINLLHQAAEVALLRGARAISPEYIIFLMRKDKIRKNYGGSSGTCTSETTNPESSKP